MEVKYLTFWLKVQILFNPIFALVTKDFQKYKIKADSDLESTELISIPQMDFIECSYFCMKEEQNGKECKAFYISNEGSCRKVELDQNPCFQKAGTGGGITLYSTVRINIVGKYIRKVFK